MNLVGCDLSLTSSAICIKNQGQTAQLYSYINEPPSNKWVKALSDVVNIISIPNVPRNPNYMLNEVEKLVHFDTLSNVIVKSLLDNLKPDETNTVIVEGYSYSSNTNAILDIVTFSTLIRFKIFHMIPYLNLKIVSPASLKLSTGMRTYGAKPFLLGKKGQILKKEPSCTNNEGVVAGKFTKHEMYKALLDSKYQHPFAHYLAVNAAEILAMKKIPSPISDIVDAVHLSECLNIK
jgi:hypothetical protein